MRTLDTFKAGYKPGNAYKTQIKTTVNTYSKIDIYLRENVMNPHSMPILDYGSGLGHGTKYLHDRGYAMSAYEPYYQPDKGVYTPHYDTIDRRILSHMLPSHMYSAIISNCVLNVLPDDIRALTLQRMFRMLEPGGILFINVQSLSAIKKTMVNGTVLSDTEVLTTRGTYQKGYTNKSLYAYVKEQLPNTIVSTGIGSVSCIVRKKIY